VLTDHWSFTVAKVPAIHLFSGRDDDWHKPTDTPDKIRPEGIMQAGKLAAALVLRASDPGQKFTFDASVLEHKLDE
jgi:hypothetical protein